MDGSLMIRTEVDLKNLLGTLAMGNPQRNGTPRTEATKEIRPAEQTKNEVNYLQTSDIPNDPEINFDRVNPWFREYWDTIDGKTETCKEFVFASMVTAFSAVLGNRWRISEVGYGIYPNLYTLLIGPSSSGKKTEAMAHGISPLDVVNQEIKANYDKSYDAWTLVKKDWAELSKKERKAQPAPPEEPINKSFLYPDENSPERLLKIMQGKPDGLFKFSEFGRLLASFNNSYMAGFKERLTQFYDGGDRTYEREIKSERIKIRDACPSILACSTPEWITKHITSEDFLSGFLARICFAYRDEPQEIFVSKYSKIDPPARLVLLFKILSFLDNKDLFLSEEAWKYYDDWYQAFGYNRLMTAEEQLRPFLTRLTIVWHKLAIINKAIRLGEVILEKILEESNDLVPELMTGVEALEAFKTITSDIRLRFRLDNQIDVIDYQQTEEARDYFITCAELCLLKLKTNVFQGLDIQTMEIIQKFGKDYTFNEQIMRRISHGDLARRLKTSCRQLKELMESLLERKLVCVQEGLIDKYWLAVKVDRRKRKG